ncbi:unnamed protein product [Linum tenue]|uniref:non-specific serine/threonine protein kinase n=1 Tax=Linum tenue TaxID=586396 RepID=A0AAV0M6I8_9ROSI|nr:unnamed protein product [Linum tenue]
MPFPTSTAVLLALSCLSIFVELQSLAQVSPPLLPPEEVEALGKLQNTGWNVERTSCGSPQWRRTIADDIECNVTCDCSYGSGTICHVTNVVVKGFNVTGVLPPELGNLTRLTELDLTRNYINGTLPSSLAQLRNLTTLFLNNNSLTGEVPGWVLNSRDNFDLSYNNFTGRAQPSCQQLDVNLVSSYSPSASNSVPWCLRKDLPCPRDPKEHTLFLNCGGPRERFEDENYEEDLTANGRSNFFSVSERWGYSSTGIYLGNVDADYLARNVFGHNVTGVYSTARLAPQSLKYYGLCMIRGSYTVKLHFAEIMYSNDQTFSSLGRRIFDISIQGEVVRPDFDIITEAGGVGRGITEVFDNVTVEGNTLEIHLFWSGKGTTAIPDRGVYGPLISGISITPNFQVDEGGGGLSGGAIAGIVVSSFLVVLLICVFIFMRRRRKDDGNSELRGLDLQTGMFTLRQIKYATHNFDPENKIGEGGFGPVYKGMLSDGGVIAVKQLSSKSKQGNREFVNEIGMISALQHPNLVKLYGCCIEGNQLLLVYEYLENNSLARALFGKQENKLKLDWQTRKNILLGIAKGLAYLHEESRLKIVHRDIKATNVLLDKDLNAKISDFGLAKLDEGENTHISTRIAGTIGYMAPEYAMRGYLTDKADVYSFGIVILETMSGTSNTNYRPKEEFVYLLDWAYVLQEQGNLLELVDPELGRKYSKEEARKLLNLALLCTNPSPTLRPPMTSVVKMMEGKAPVQAPIIKRGESDASSADARFRAFQTLSQDSHTNISNVSWESSDPGQKSISMVDAPWTMNSSAVSKDDHDDDASHLSQPSSSTRLL